MIKRTFSLEPEVDSYLQGHANRSKTINAIIKRHMQLLEEEKMTEAYQQMAKAETFKEFQEWEQVTIRDGLND